ncbi:flavodoxin family protein [uncultured Alistipes sp.]|uniref:flavodoxin family protein n=1 Tax=uncultured Alistipes sp. TaxID=538949 RepID=UPI00260CC0CA|nr:flavodoxin family protein [uncultured Alistipes sp.]
MKVVVINGSPHRAGLVSQMLGHAVAALPSDCEVAELFVRDLTVRPCVGCMKCRSLRRCVLPEDDAHRAARLIREADALIVGSPCYWGSMSGALKVLFDRMVYALMGERENGLPEPLHRGKRVVLVATCNTAYPWSILFHQSSGVFRSLREIFRWSGFKVVGTVAKSGCRKHPELTSREIAKCRTLGGKLVKR